MNSSSGLGSSSYQQQRKNSNQNIQVYVRLRPLNAREKCIRSTEVIDVISPREIMTRHSLDSKLTKKFTFDRTFGPDSRQMDVYSTVVAPLIEEVLSGYNCTVFAYGQTGTGKTHTMVGTECAELKSSWEDDSDIGIIPRALSHLFDELRLLEMEFSMRISYLELYNEELCDLLSSDDNTKIRIFDDSTKKGSVIIQGLEEIPVHSKDDVYKLLEKGKERRKTATTLMNAQSSRSHTVFSILVHIRENGIDGEEMLKIGKLNLVDLAGSENVSKAGNEKGIRVRETVNINQSLLTLGRVITALVERTPHIPYRESKLTRLLQESLGGRTKTSIIATISPGHKDIEETLSTLEYAHRAKNIQNRPEVNQKLTKKTVLKEYTEEIDKLKRDLIAARDKNGIYLAEETYTEMTLKMDSQNRELNEKMLLLKALKDELQNKERIFNEVSLNLVEKTEELKRTEQNLTQTKGTLLQTKKVLHNTKKRYKEKKLLLQSHVKTEEELTNQASQILQVADIATNDTNELHSTIDRRKEVDQKIKTACERFSDCMRENFELMDENLDDLQNQHKSYAQLILEEFTNSTNAQNAKLSESKQKIQLINDMCSKSLATTSAITDKFSNKLKNLSTEHKTMLIQLFADLKNKEIELHSQISCNLSELLAHNDEQKSTIDAMREHVQQTLQRNTSEVLAYATQMQEHIVQIAQVAEISVQELAQLQTEIARERSLADEEQATIDEFVNKMQTIRQQRMACVDQMGQMTIQLKQNCQQTQTDLKQSVDCTQSFCKQRGAENSTAQDVLEQQATAGVLCIDQSIAKCSKLQTQLDNLGRENGKRINGLVTTATTICTQTEQTVEEHVSIVKRMRLEDEQNFVAACATVGECLDSDTQQLKAHIVIASGIASSIQHQVRDYAGVFKSNISKCRDDLAKFQQSELLTYAPTGTTPSKREFLYPRKLKATSPHNQIVQRFCLENDWSDLDTTATIDEEISETEEEPISVQNLSETETILNSTPQVDAPEVMQKRNSNANVDSRNSNSLKPPPMQIRNSSLSKRISPGKRSPRNSPSNLKEYKENVC